MTDEADVPDRGPESESMADVDHESPDGASADRVFERGPDEDGV